MANETILVVDDAPVNLKLTDILLRKEGYKVHATSDAEQALSLMRSCRPDLMLVDIQLPGMNGLELTRRIKQDSRTRDIVVVALTACAMKGDDERAFQAGCDGYITKPIETLTLAKKIREYLENRNAPAMAPEPRPAEAHTGFPGGLTLSPAELEAIRRRFLEEAVQQCQRLLEGLDRQLNVQEALQLVHSWAAAAQVLDYPVIAILASEVEKLLRSRNPDPVVLGDALSNLLVGFVEPPEATMGPVPGSVESLLKGRIVGLVGCTDEISRQLCGALERASAKPRLFPASCPADPEALKACSALVIHARPETFGTRWLHPANFREFKQPLILIGVRDHLMDLEPSILPRAGAMLIDGWQPEEALIRIGQAMARDALLKAPPEDPPPPLRNGLAPVNGFSRPRNSNTETEILLADDDLTVRMVVRGIMQGAGIKCRMACDGNEALRVIRDCRPTLVVLDVNMPGIDGYEVLAATRQEGLPVRVVLLTARQTEADITRGFNLGADDYVVKPFNPPELLARIKRFL